MDIKVKEWNDSYERKENFIFYPNEDIVRFVSKYIRKRIGYDEYINHFAEGEIPKILDFGCGIGRHIDLLDDFGLDGYGFDLSSKAIEEAKLYFRKHNKEYLVSKIIEANITDLPYEDNSFDFMLSHGVLDSMPFEVAKKGFRELCRCLKVNGFIYFDVISTNDWTFSDKENDQIVTSEHEFGTIQSYYDANRINKLLTDKIKINEIFLSEKKDIMNNKILSRYHVVVQKIS